MPNTDFINLILRWTCSHRKSFPYENKERRLDGAMAIFAHTAFALGAIRQMIRVVRE